jgi:hypothetical protein
MVNGNNALRSFLRRLNPEDLPIQGTAIGRATCCDSSETA